MSLPSSSPSFDRVRNTMKKHKGEMRSVVSFGDLPKEIITDILLRLDVKSLQCCECVCKSWKTLTRQQSFIDSHFKRQPSSVIFITFPYLYCRRGKKSTCLSRHSESFDEIQNYDCERFPTWPLTLNGGDNGVLCFSNLGRDYVCLCNPATNGFKRLPDPPSHWKRFICCIGVGFDRSTNDFKVVMINGYNKVVVYSLRGNCWKTMEMPDKFSLVASTGHYFCSFVVGGCIHWTMFYKKGAVGSSSFDIVAFDLSTEAFKGIEPPKRKDYGDFFLGKLSECLSLVIVDHAYPALVFEIWVMKEYGVSDSWVKQVKVDVNTCPYPELFPENQVNVDVDACLYQELFPDLRTRSLIKADYRAPFGLANNGNVLIACGDHWYWYDFKSHKFRYLRPRTNDSALVCCSDYVESMIRI